MFFEVALFVEIVYEVLKVVWVRIGVFVSIFLGRVLCRWDRFRDTPLWCCLSLV